MITYEQSIKEMKFLASDRNFFIKGSGGQDIFGYPYTSYWHMRSQNQSLEVYWAQQYLRCCEEHKEVYYGWNWYYRQQFITSCCN